MTAQAKNRILAFLILSALLVIMAGCVMHNTTTGESDYLHVYVPSEVPSAVVVTTADTADKRQFECLRLNIYHEAGNQSRRGMEAVALVTVNRTKTKHYPSTICGVVHDAVVVNGQVQRYKCQFSWYCDGKDDKPRLYREVKDKEGNVRLVANKREIEAWEQAGEVALAVMNGEVEDFLGRATHYHATYVNPHWSRVPRYRYLTRVGSHLFYRDSRLGLKV